jgi:hypothetical protein
MRKRENEREQNRMHGTHNVGANEENKLKKN